MSDPRTKTSKERVSTADLEACRSWLVARGDSLARSRDMILMVDELLERRSSETLEQRGAGEPETAEKADTPAIQESGLLATRSRRQIDGAALADAFKAGWIKAAEHADDRRLILWAENDDATYDLGCSIYQTLREIAVRESLANAQKASEVRDSIAPNMHCPVCDRWFWTDKFDGHKCVSQGK